MPTGEAFVLRYDGHGKLIQPQSQSPNEDGSQLEGASFEPEDSSGISLREAQALPAIRLVSARYQDNPALADLGLSRLQWATFFQAMIRVESGYDPRALSTAGAKGLAQLMPDTARSLGVEIDDPLQNLDGGARYLLDQMATFGSLKLALAAYNAGPEAVRAYGGVPPYSETQSHILRVMAEYNRLLGTL